jgi:hypothetical protein
MSAALLSKKIDEMKFGPKKKQYNILTTCVYGQVGAKTPNCP